MASLSTPLNVDEEIVRNFQSALEGGSIRFLQVEVENEQLVQKSTHNSSGNLGDDYDRMVDLVNEESACYFLFKVQPKEWLLITYVPDGVPVKDKMLYASAKGALKDRLGHSYLEEEIHTTTKEELSYDHYKGEKKPTDARSNFEIEHEKVIQEENEARDEMLKQAVQKEETGSGGFHSVTIPLAASAKSALDRFKSGEVNFVVLAVDDSKSSIISSDAKKIDTSRASAEIHTGEPRFYVLNQAGKPTVFIYCCPSRSPPKLRMVYSTSKPNVINQLTQYGLNLAAKRIEITEGEDLADELKDAQTSTTIKPSLMKPGGGNFTGRMIQPAPGSVPALGGTVKASNLPTMQNSGHSIYSLMVKPGTETASTKKKIVIPPRGAW